jgi:molybdopterin/thiamine biosynthesis adenylyltransferase
MEVCAAGLSRLPGRLEWLVHNPTRQAVPAGDTAPRLCVLAADAVPDLAPRLLAALRNAPADALIAALALGTGRAAGHLAGLCHTPQGIRALDGVTLCGPGLAGLLSSNPTDPETRRGHLTPTTSAPHALADTAIWSRTVGALGEVTWQRLRRLNVAVIGCGRSGSVAAITLGRLSVSRLTLIDPDRLEPHNLGEMDGVGPADLGRAKAHAVAASVAGSLVEPGAVVGVPVSILSLTGSVAAKQAEVLFCCVDNPAARLATALLAALYVKPLLDVGTGIFRRGGARRLGADVRLVLPERCLLCCGGIAELRRGRAELLAGVTVPGNDRADQDAWRQERAGSLRSLNGVAVSLAVRLLEDLVGARVVGSTWLHLEFQEDGIPTLEHRQPPANPRCRLCALTARGDQGIPELAAFLHEL